jgi:hypothetical protein
VGDFRPISFLNNSVKMLTWELLSIVRLSLFLLPICDYL